MRTLVDLDDPHGENVRLVQKLLRGERLTEPPWLWKIQLLFSLEGDWMEICRADNYPHEGKKAAHIHIGKKVIPFEGGFEEASGQVWEKSRIRIKNLYNHDIGDKQ